MAVVSQYCLCLKVPYIEILAVLGDHSCELLVRCCHSLIDRSDLQSLQQDDVLRHIRSFFLDFLFLVLDDLLDWRIYLFIFDHRVVGIILWPLLLLGYLRLLFNYFRFVFNFFRFLFLLFFRLFFHYPRLFISLLHIVSLLLARLNHLILSFLHGLIRLLLCFSILLSALRLQLLFG